MTCLELKIKFRTYDFSSLSLVGRKGQTHKTDSNELAVTKVDMLPVSWPKSGT